MSEYQPDQVMITMPLATVERIRAALLVAAACAEECAADLADGKHISLLPLSKQRSAEAFLADRAECLDLLNLIAPQSPTP
jgi:hypothetical protein